ncbi:hypothetical protein S83_015379, partial [Arachis hypogaea]
PYTRRVTRAIIHSSLHLSKRHCSSPLPCSLSEKGKRRQTLAFTAAAALLTAVIPPSFSRPPPSPLLCSPTPLLIRQLLRVASPAPVRKFVAHRPWLSVVHRRRRSCSLSLILCSLLRPK